MSTRRSGSAGRPGLGRAVGPGSWKLGCCHVVTVGYVAMIFGMLDPGVLGFRMAHQH